MVEQSTLDLLDDYYRQVLNASKPKQIVTHQGILKDLDTWKEME